MFELPRIRIEVENMKYQIMHAFTSHNDEIEKYVDQELTKAIQNYPWGREVAEISRDVIRASIESSIKDFFLYGDGKTLVDEAVKEALSNISKKK